MNTRPEPLTLAALQHWFAQIVRDDQNAEHGARSRAARAYVPARDVERGAVVAVTPQLTPFARLDIYNDGYLSRLVESLRGDYPGLHAALGADGFLALTRRYVARHPSRHPNLFRLGLALPSFVARSRSLPGVAFLSELARLEAAIIDSFHEREEPRLDGNAMSAIAPEDWPRVVLRVHPAVRISRYRYPVGTWLHSVLRGEPESIPAASLETVLVHRAEFDVHHAVLDADAARVLRALIAGQTLGVALRKAGGAAEHVGAWLRDWTAGQVFCGISVAT